MPKELLYGPQVAKGNAYHRYCLGENLQGRQNVHRVLLLRKEQSLWRDPVWVLETLCAQGTTSIEKLDGRLHLEEVSEIGKERLEAAGLINRGLPYQYAAQLGPWVADLQKGESRWADSRLGHDVCRVFVDGDKVIGVADAYNLGATSTHYFSCQASIYDSTLAAAVDSIKERCDSVLEAFGWSLPERRPELAREAVRARAEWLSFASSLEETLGKR